MIADSVCLEPFRLLRYPGGKQRHMRELQSLLPAADAIPGCYFEPFAGSAAVFFSIKPHTAILADINKDLIDFYAALSASPDDIWGHYVAYPSTKEGYYQVRNSDPTQLDLTGRAARTLYLNRTCYKGMWRHNASGQFNVGYGGEERRWAITRESLLAAARYLSSAQLVVSDFEPIIDSSCSGDFIFVDPPYRPGERDLIADHYTFSRFGFSEHRRLADALARASRRGVKWALTTSAHPDIRSLFPHGHVLPFRLGTGRRPGLFIEQSGEVLIRNY